MSTPLQINKFAPNDQSRLGRMLQGGRLTATLRSKRSGDHITVTLKSSAKIENKWQPVPFSEATHVFISQGQGGWGGVKVGTYYPQKGLLYLDRGFETAPWVYTIKQIFAAAESGILDTDSFTIFEEDRCGVCGKALTDPISIERGIGPTCIGALTGSHHYSKGDSSSILNPNPSPVSTEITGEQYGAFSADAAEYHQGRVARRVLETNDVMNAVLGGPSRKEARAIVDKKGRTLPKTFADLARSAR